MNETTQAAAEGHEMHGLAHVMPVRMLGAVWIGLLVLTVVTVAVTRVDLGALNLWIAMGIATTKAVMVALYFMHLRYDRPFNAIVFVTAFFFFLLFVGFALMDTAAYSPEMIPGYAPAMQTP